MDFNATGQLIIYSVFVKYLRRNGKTMRQCINYLQTKIDHNSLRRDVLYNILIEVDIPIKLVRPMKMYLNEAYSRVQVGKHLSDMCPAKNGLNLGGA